MTDSLAARTPDTDIRVTVALSAAILVQSGLALIWAGGAAERISQLERRAGEVGVVVERTARLEEQVRAARASLERIETKLDRLADGREEK